MYHFFSAAIIMVNKDYHLIGQWVFRNIAIALFICRFVCLFIYLLVSLSTCLLIFLDCLFSFTYSFIPSYLFGQHSQIRPLGRFRRGIAQKTQNRSISVYFHVTVRVSKIKTRNV